MMKEVPKKNIQSNFQHVCDEIAKAAQSVGRSSKDVKLVVVTKGHGVESLKAVVEGGACCIGENYVEQAIPKIESVVDRNIEWHMIGHIQSRKAKPVSEYFDWVHSVDRLKIANRLNNFASQWQRTLPILLECNVSQEASKFGWSAWDEAQWSVLADSITPLFELGSLEVRGLMTMPPYDPDPEKSRPYFVKLSHLRDYLASQFPQTNWSDLSMGMSGDYVVAIQEGATIVRVGTAIMGSRQ
jgi:pyridoxal phosphate enzyme (YggS family)